MRTVKNVFLYIIVVLAALAALLGVPYYVVLNNHDFYFKTDKITLGEGNEFQIDLIPKDGSKFDINDYVFESDNTNIVEVSKDGKITSKGLGTTTIKVKYKYSLFPKKIEVTVTDEMIEVEKITLNKTKATLYVGETVTLKETIKPDNATEKSVSWSSNDKRIATVDENGEVTAVGRGTTVITVETVNGKKAKATIIVKEKFQSQPQKEPADDKPKTITVKGVSLNKNEAKITVGEKYQLKATLSPSNATNKSVTWSSGDTAVATVDKTGLVTGKKEGVATITVKTTNGKTAKCKITVKNDVIEVKSITLDNKEAKIGIGEEIQLNETINPSNATNQTVTWKSSDTNVATVNNSGLVTGKKAGTSTITVRTANGKTATCKVTVSTSVVEVTGVTLDRTSDTIVTGKTTQLNETVLPSNATNQTVTWSSSDDSVATVSNTGLVTCKKAGTATITVKTANGKTATCKITVKAETVAVTGITLNKTTDGILVGKTSQLSATISPNNATNKTVTWSSSDSSVATVNSSGLVTGKAIGTATITAKSNNGKTATCKVTVSKATVEVTSIKINQTNTTIKINGTLQLSTTISPSNATNQTVSWTSSKTDVATVSSSGLVTPKKAGTTTITAKSNNGKTASITVKVEKLNDTVTITTKTASYTGSEITPTVKATSGSEITLTYYSDSSCKTKTSKPKNIGTYYAIASSTGNGTYNSGTSACTKAVIINSVEVTGITLNKTSVGVLENKTAQLSATITPSNATNKTVTWSSNKTDIAIVSNTGLVTGKKAGTATITAKSNNGKTATCTVTVSKATIDVTSIKINQSNSTIKINGTLQLSTTISPSNATNQTVTWSSNSTSIATVSNTGLVTGKGAGNATITVKSNNGKTASITVKVEKLSDTVTITAKTATYSGNEITPTVKATSGSTISIEYYSDSSCKTKTSAPKNVGTYYAIATSSGNVTYNPGTSACTKAVVINKKNDTVKITLKSAEYTGNGIGANASATSGSTITIKYFTDSACKTPASTPKEVGTYYATATSAGNGTYNSGTSACTKAVVITKPVVKSVTLDRKTVNLFEGKTASLVATVTPAILKTEKLTWKSSDASVATVTSTGKISAIKEGTATITVSSSNGKTASCTVKVKSTKVTVPLKTSSGNDLAGGDPFVTYDKSRGYYYYLATRGYNIEIYVSKNLQDIGKPEKKVTVWKNDQDAVVWAPELHHINNRWYIYYTNATKGKSDYWSRRMYVLRSKTDDPLGEYEYMGKLYDKKHDAYAIDGTVFQWNNQLYYVYSGNPGSAGAGTQYLYIARMSNPYTLATERVKIAAPKYDWEKKSAKINEGPEVIIRNNKVHIIYSGNAAQSKYYVLGMLTYSGGDILKADNWKKYSKVLFESGNGVYGPGHASFTTSKDGKEDWIVYHAYASTDLIKNWGRTIRIKKFTWNGDIPVFGKPDKTGSLIDMPSGSTPD